MTRDKVDQGQLQHLRNRFGLEIDQVDPEVFWRITQDFLELTVRYLAPDHGGRSMKDQMNREIMAGLERAGIAIGATRQEAVPPPKVSA